MPRDPFADDPNDPASFLEEEEFEPLTPEERVAATNDLMLMRQARRLLVPKGCLGICSYCDSCEEPHYYDWDIIIANTEASIRGEAPLVHEPSAEPLVEAYAPWEYCVGYVDAWNDANRPS
ncbi:hypothetical protein CCHOA_09300 [Corynebacterium choanae]|uniref:DUF5319 domain-containing protein n=2 Tax=Corynebacterium choanae TaxID=1862358 RepID=A0A3G6J8Z2_9CORY|nr:hypothetical protein CCHOA_09300 [Corynebacterium choanae]